MFGGINMNLKFFKRFYAILLVIYFGVFVAYFANAVGSGEIGARSLSQGTDVFLGGNYIELGLSKVGSFGTSSTPPTTGSIIFHPQTGLRLGMVANLTGQAADWNKATGDFFMPGTIDEGYLIGWGGALKASGSEIGTGNSGIISSTTVDQSVGKELKAMTTATITGGIELTQIVSFQEDSKFFITTVTLKNTSSEDMTNMRYMRRFDPDQGQAITGDFVTKNVIGHQELNEYGVSVFAFAKKLGTSVYDATPYIFFSNDPRAVAGYASSISFSGLYTDGSMTTTSGSEKTADVDIFMRFDIGTLAAGESTTLTWISSLDTSLANAIEAIKATLDIKVETEKGTLSGFEKNNSYTVELDGSTDIWEVVIDEDGNYVIKDATAKTIAIGSEATSKGITILEEWYNKKIIITKQGASDIEPKELDIGENSGEGEIDDREIAPDSISLSNIYPSGISIKVTPTVSGQEYAIYSSDMSILLKEWVKSTDGGAITFSGLEYNTNYNVVTRTSGSEALLPSAPVATLTKTKPATALVPTTTVVTARSDTAITYTKVTNQEYSIDNGLSWSSTGTFTGLNSNTDYVIKTRIVENDTYAPSNAVSTNVKTKKSSANAGTPVTAVVTSRTDTAIAYTKIAGQEYSIDNGANWSSTGTFTGLTSDTNYTIKTRIAETDLAMPSNSVSTTLRTKKSTVNVGTPVTAVVTSRTDTAITYTTVTGQEYSIDNGANWSSTGSFIGLTSDTNYTIKTRIAETDLAMPSNTVSTNAKTKKSSVNAGIPVTAVVTSRTDTAITYTTVTGQEYSIDNGANWSSTGSFIGLTSDTNYTIKTRIAETDLAMPSNTVSTNAKTKISSANAGTPVTAVVTSRTDTTIAYTKVTGQEYSIDNGANWSSTGSFAGLYSDTNYTIKTRIAETDLAMPSNTVSTNAKTKISSISVGLPISTVITSKTDTTITYTKIAGQEYSLDGGITWSSTGIFTGLMQNSDYEIITRIAETSTAMAGVVSQKTNAITDCKIVGSVIGADLPAKIQLIDLATNEIAFEVLTNNLGEYQVILPAGDYQAVILGSSGAQSLITPVLAPNVTQVDFELKGGTVVKGSVKSKDGKVVDQALITLLDKNGKEVASTIANSNGTFYFEGVADGIYSANVLGVVDGEVVSMIGNISIKNSIANGNDIVVVNGYLTFGGQIIANGLPIQGATITIKDISTGKITAQTVTDNAGNYVLVGQQLGAYLMEITDNLSGTKHLRNVTIAKTGISSMAAQVSPMKIDLTRSIENELWIKNNLFSNDNLIVAIDKDIYAHILDIKNEWDKLSGDDQEAINNLLKTVYNSQTFDDLYLQASELDNNTNLFILEYLTLIDGELIKEVTQDNYERIIAACDSRNDLSQDERYIIDEKLVKNGSKTFAQLLREAKVFAPVNTADVNNYFLILLLVIIVVTGYVIYRNKDKLKLISK